MKMNMQLIMEIHLTDSAKYKRRKISLVVRIFLIPLDPPVRWLIGIPFPASKKIQEAH
jgi:hypothetical protein